ncbi:putative mediator of rna polymerase ii transcription subunit 10 protein [Lasiodiplodia theobromae]|uniref:Mediator of RNA polymerase II transcription subunit 10 n=1 Tax=Lasiodiplodia hormozganensis TaxID=869390 RepID=A0AA39Y7S7_9PEZI|nr:Mediator of RNA polymerase ii transcription [Lasiodiplodia theobromae]KAF4535245.1 Mediator of RNA polymerase ii transcription [Lasiodiplodia theobromae]KAF9636823.1 putative mediator of rna polymerase ii transcription subunit 10 protein [Lasiodiplodia theobromae]KAK0647627.1 Mediator of RNA polymerase II transcription subunit 10 [Lasiodiplodia hormozganensis]
MAPDVPAKLEPVDGQIKKVIQNLYHLVVQVHDYQGTNTEDAMKREITNLLGNLLQLSREASGLALHIPPDIISYVENGRNPDIYTREFAELVQKNNQKLKGKSEAFAQFRDILASKIITAFPEMEQDAKRIVSNTGGNPATL